MRKYLPAVLAATAFLGASAAPSSSKTAPAKCNDAYALHGARPGVKASCGQRVKDVQWLLGGHKPSVYTKTAPTFRWAPNGAYGARTKASVKALKYRIGYPKAGECGLGPKTTYVTDTVGPLFMSLIEGKATRPMCWVGLASSRIKGTVVTGATPAALRIKALMLTQLGTHEVPSGSNRGPRISFTSGGYGPYQGSTGAFGAAWCASFWDWALKSVLGHGYGSANDAYVPTILETASARGQLQAKPRVGAAAGFLTADGRLADAYHVGFVVKVTATGVQTIEGNSGTTWGGMVREVWRPFATYHMVYVYPPGVA